MKILLDECLPQRFRHSIPGYEAHTVQWAGLKGLKNGELLKAAEAAGYEVLLTIDQSIPYQQSAEGRRIAVIVMRAKSNRRKDLLPLAESMPQAMKTIKQGDFVFVPSSVTI